MSGFETGHPAAAGPMPAFFLSVSDEQDAAFLVSVMDCSDCDSSGLDSPNSSWSIARLKEYLRRKKRPSKREKAELLERDYLHRHRHLESFFFFLCSFFSLFLFLFSSFPAYYAPYFSSTGTQPDKYCFTFSAILFGCTLRVGRSIGGSFTNFTSLALQPLVFRQLWIKSGFIIWPTGVICTLSLRAVPFSASFSTLIPLETGARRLQVAGAKKKKEKRTPMALHVLSGSD